MLRLYWKRVIRPFKWSIVGLAALSLLSAGLSVISVGLVVPIVAGITGEGPRQTDFLTDWIRRVAQLMGVAAEGQWLVLVGLVVITIALVTRAIFLILYQWVTYRVAIDGWHSTARSMLRVYLTLRFAELSKRGRGRIAQDLQAPPEAISNVIAYASRALASLVETAVLGALILYLSWWAGLICFLMGVLGLFLMRRVILVRIDHCHRQSYGLFQKVSALIIDALDGIRTIKLGNAKQRVLNRLESLLQQHRRVGIQYGILAEVPASATEVLMMLSLIVVVWISLIDVRVPFSTATLAGLVIAFVRLKAPAQLLVQSAVQLAANVRKLQVIDEALEELAAEQSESRNDPRGCLSVPEVINELTLRGITFAYGDGDLPVLKEITFSCRRGHVTAVVGATGSGKTTIADLIARLYEPQAGAILVDGVNVGGVDIGLWRSQLGYVSQDCFLFNGSLRDNITLWDSEIPDEDIDRAMRAARLEDVVESLPERYETIVGDRGVKLSGGQRQRVAIARALVRRPQILIFDEATSALDNLTEKEVHNAITSFRRNSIVVVIAHRMTTVRDADSIIVLEAGRVVERGSHRDLLAARGQYCQLYLSEEREETADEVEAAK